ncbi:carboxylesterase [Friedmanniella luteola]|uniref:Carboxylesterase n=1 Tax=Friedmanniella luteola TaxID=546871 RepID=A0A1H1P6K3_9ACTN|nr:alpha/beta fold hydrolase [Friedmanniella luteola]SDS06822.1 carboxylesterase [Friedmanniella luteola]
MSPASTSAPSSAVRGLLGRLTGYGRPAGPAPTSAPVVPQAQPYAGGSGPYGVLLCHGFTGTPHSMRPWAEHLEAAGFRVVLPRLPGHGTSWQELNRTQWTDWYAAVDRAFVDLTRQCERVGVAGLSMGGALALRLAEQHGDAVAALALVNPCINITDPRIRFSRLLSVVPSLRGIAGDIAKPGEGEFGYTRNPLRALHSQTELWADVRAGLDRVTSPTQVYWSRQDHVVDPSSLALIRAGVRTPDLEVVTLERSYHVATLDYDADDIFRGSADFFRRHVGDRA